LFINWFFLDLFFFEIFSFFQLFRGKEQPKRKQKRYKAITKSLCLNSLNTQEKKNFFFLKKKKDFKDNNSQSS